MDEENEKEMLFLIEKFIQKELVKNGTIKK